MSKYSLTNLLNEIVEIDIQQLESIANRFASNGYTYIPFNLPVFTKHSILLWLEDNIGDGGKAFTVQTKKHRDDDLMEINIYVMPEEQSYLYSDATQDDVDLITGAGQLNEEDLSYTDPLDEISNGGLAEEFADRLAEIGARYVELDSLAEHEADLDSGADSDAVQEYIQQDLKNQYTNEDSLVYTHFPYNEVIYTYDGKYHDFFYLYVFSDFHISQNDQIVDMIKGASELTEYKDPEWDASVDYGNIANLIDKLAEIGAVYLDTKETRDFFYSLGDEGEDINIGDVERYYKDQFDEDDTLYYSMYDEQNSLIFSDGVSLDLAPYSREELQDLIDVGQMNYNIKKKGLTEAKEGWDDNIDWQGKKHIPEDLANTLADLGAGYYELTDDDLAEIELREDDEEADAVAEWLQRLERKLIDDYPILYTFHRTQDDDSYFIFSDDSYVYATDWSPEDVEMVKDAGQYGRLDEAVNEEFDLNSDRVNNLLKTYAKVNLDFIANDSGQDFSQDQKYKFSTAIAAGNDRDRVIKPIDDFLIDFVESSWAQTGANDIAVEVVEEEFPDIAREFYGVEYDERMLRDAGRVEAADFYGDEFNTAIENILDENYELRYSSYVQRIDETDKFYMGMDVTLYDIYDGSAALQVELSEVYKDITSLEALKDALKDFQENKLPSVRTGEKPSKVAKNEVEEAVEPIKESVESEELINNITTWPLHYVDLQDSVENDMIARIQETGMRDTYEVEEYIWQTVADHLDDLDKKAGYAEDEEEGYFTMLGPDFWQEIGWFRNSDQWDVYTSDGLLDTTFTLSGQDVDDVIEAGQLYNDTINESKDVLEADEDAVYNPSFETIDEVIENAVIEIMDPVSQAVEGYGDNDTEELTSGDGSFRYADGGYKSSVTTHMGDNIGYGIMPTKELDAKIEEDYENLYNENLVDAAEDLAREGSEIYTEFYGVPADEVYDAMVEASEAYRGVDDKKAGEYQDAADDLSDKANDYTRESDSGWLYFEVEIQYMKADNDDNTTGEPLLMFRGEASTNYTVLAAKEIELNFTSEEEMEQALVDGSKELVNWFEGGEKVDSSQIKEAQVNESREDDIYNLVKQEAQKRITPGFYNPEEDFDPDSSSRYSDVRISEKSNIPFSEYLNGTLTLPKDFETNVVEEMYIIFYKAAEQEVFSNIEDYLPEERSKEFIGIEDEIGDMFISGDLRDMDPNLYEEISNEIQEIANRYSEESGVHRGFEGFIDNDKKTISFTAEVSVDPEYKDVEKKKEVEITFDEADQIPAIIQQMDEWLQGN